MDIAMAAEAPRVSATQPVRSRRPRGEDASGESGDDRGRRTDFWRPFRHNGHDPVHSG
jgi:hypothetical protein